MIFYYRKVRIDLATGAGKDRGGGGFGDRYRFIFLIYIYIKKTMMKTSISSEALSQLGTEKITFPPKRGWRTYRQTAGYLYL